jgi:hypothetical protein
MAALAFQRTQKHGITVFGEGFGDRTHMRFGMRPTKAERVWTHRWSGMDSNFQYAGAVNLIVAHLVLGLLLWVSQGVPILRTTPYWREMESNYWFPVAKTMNPVREPEPKPSRR